MDLYGLADVQEDLKVLKQSYKEYWVQNFVKNVNSEFSLFPVARI